MNVSRRRLALLVIAALTLAGAGANAGEIYRWVDDTGRTHISDTVPERYRAGATRYDSKSFEQSEADRQRAQRRAAEDQERAADDSRRRPRADQDAAKSGKAAPSNETDCQKAHRLYRESLECFGPFRTAGQGIKAEAFAACGQPVLDPSNRCGPMK